MRRIVYLMIITLMVFSCKNETTPDAQQLVDKAIEASGGTVYNNFIMDFDFRDKHYKTIRNGGTFQYERHFEDSLGQVRDVLTNDGFKRFINNELATIPDSMAFKYSNSVNSVHYFVLLPFGLNDAAVHKTYKGTATIKGAPYHRIQVTFQQDGGGKDFEDVFAYWIHAETFKVDYLAYSYLTDGGGVRFREAYNERFVNGLRVVDYNNYKPEDKNTDLFTLDSLFENDELKLLSKIENKNVVVTAN